MDISSNWGASSPIDIFLIPGRYALELICSFFQAMPGEIQPQLYLIYSAMLAFVIWAWCLNICATLVKRAFDRIFPPTGRY